jgi:hypothetical protein
LFSVSLQCMLRNHWTRVIRTRIKHAVPIRRVARMCFSVAGLPSLARNGFGFRISITPIEINVITTTIPNRASTIAEVPHRLKWSRTSPTVAGASTVKKKIPEAPANNNPNTRILFRDSTVVAVVSSASVVSRNWGHQRKYLVLSGHKSMSKLLTNHQHITASALRSTIQIFISITQAKSTRSRTRRARRD